MILRPRTEILKSWAASEDRGLLSIDPHVMRNVAWILGTFASAVTAVSQDYPDR